MADVDIVRASILTPGLCHRWGLPLRLEGKPGTAKTALITQIAEEEGFHVEVVIASLRDPSDFLGVAVPVTEKDGTTTVEYAPPAWALRAAKAQYAVVLFDEINSAVPAVQAALHRVVLEGQVGDYKLPNTVVFIAAMNAVEDATGGQDVAMALGNRFGLLADWEGATPQQWCQWIVTAGNGNETAKLRDAAETMKAVKKAWPEHFAKAAGVWTSYISKNPAELNKPPAPDSPEASRAWSSMRTNEMAVRALAASSLHNLSEIDTQRFVGAFVGAAAARQFFAWKKMLDLPDCAALLDGSVSYKHDPDRLDRSMVVFRTCAAIVAPSNAEKRQPRTAALWKLLKSHLDFADIIFPAAVVLCDSKVRLVRGFAEADVVLAKLAPVLRAAGITVTK